MAFNNRNQENNWQGVRISEIIIKMEQKKLQMRFLINWNTKVLG